MLSVCMSDDIYWLQSQQILPIVDQISKLNIPLFSLPVNSVGNINAFNLPKKSVSRSLPRALLNPWVEVHCFSTACSRPSGLMEATMTIRVSLISYRTNMEEEQLRTGLTHILLFTWMDSFRSRQNYSTNSI